MTGVELVNMAREYSPGQATDFQVKILEVMNININLYSVVQANFQYVLMDSSNQRRWIYVRNEV